LPHSERREGAHRVGRGRREREGQGRGRGTHARRARAGCGRRRAARGAHLPSDARGGEPPLSAARLRTARDERVRLAGRLVSRAVIRTQPQRGGWLEVVCGPMFSGKSEELIRRLRRAEIAGQKALIVKPAIDDRYDVGHVVSHAGAKMRAVTAATSGQVLHLATGDDAVGIDEVQFFDGEIVETVNALVARGTRVVVSGLAQDFRALPFGAMPTLLCIAEFVDKLEAVCHRCGGAATLTQRLVDGKPAPFSGETVQIGALDSYEARGRACYEPGDEDAALKTASSAASPPASPVGGDPAPAAPE